MNIVFTYLKAHLAKDATAAVDMADYNPSYKNLSFARRILDIKIKNTDIKYILLSSRLDAIRQEKEYKESRLRYNKESKLLQKNHSNRGLGEWDFKNRDLRDFKFENLSCSEKIDQKLDFSDSNLTSVDLSRKYLEGANFTNSNLSKTKICINDADFTNAKLDDAEIKFNFRYENNKFINVLGKKKIFHTLSSIDDKYSNIEINLIKQIINEMNYFPGNELRPQYIFSMLNCILSRDYYLEDEVINSFAEKLEASLFHDKFYNIRFDRLSSDFLLFFLDVCYKIYSEKGLNNFMLEYNDEFIKLMAISLYHDNLIIREKSRGLYNKYLDLERIKPFFEKNELDNDKKVDWDSKGENYNFILIYENKTMVINYKELNKMIFYKNKESDVQWTLFFIYINEECQNVNKINYYELFNKDFQIFQDSYNAFILNQNSQFDKLLLNLGNYHQQFYSALIGKLIQDKDKLVDIKNQNKLTEVFEKLLVLSDNKIEYKSLEEKHYQKICEIFKLERSNNEEKSKYLLTLATMFVNYSSSTLFGTEYDSPQILRYYAYALMSKANELNPKLMGDNFKSWSDRLLGKNNAFTCTSILFTRMRDYGKIHFASILNEIMPPHWK